MEFIKSIQSKERRLIWWFESRMSHQISTILISVQFKTVCHNLLITHSSSTFKVIEKHVIEQPLAFQCSVSLYSVNSPILRTLAVIFGGKLGESLSNETIIANLEQGVPTLSTLSVGGQKPNPRYKHASAILADHLYIHGGISFENRTLGDTFRLCLTTLTWECIKVPHDVDLPPRAGHLLLSHRSSELYLFGGSGTCAETMLPSYRIKIKRDKFKWNSLVDEGCTALCKSKLNRTGAVGVAIKNKVRH
ncbi:hypothetical protein Ciccas_003816 [Cichlidogyrus casuarinus]|uniref:Uncharacterized protein n=1 Tax=Cichlidogyrus casuarinus TaxID=1844966 RepID=A0ABD2QDC7_9PLAT